MIFPYSVAPATSASKPNLVGHQVAAAIATSRFIAIAGSIGGDNVPSGPMPLVRRIMVQLPIFLLDAIGANEPSIGRQHEHFVTAGPSKLIAGYQLKRLDAVVAVKGPSGSIGTLDVFPVDVHFFPLVS
jgi:hypothetical protein